MRSRWLTSAWRLITGSLLHAGELHLVINLLFLLYVGRSIEAILGPGGIALLVVVSGPGSMAISSWATEAATVGASGITFGLFGAAVALGWRFDEWLPGSVRAKFGWSMFPFVLLFLLLGVQSPGVDNSCHVGGLLLGGALGFVLPSPLARPHERRRHLALKEFSGAAVLTLSFWFLLPVAWDNGVLPHAAASSREHPVSELGITLNPPRHWRLSRSTQGGPTWMSAAGSGQLSVQTWVEELGVLRPEDVRRRWMGQFGREGTLTERSNPPPAELGLPEQWIAVEGDYVEGAETFRFLRVGILRGSYLTQVEFLHPREHWDSYGPLRLSVLQSLKVTTPAAVVEAVERALPEGTFTGGEVLPYVDVMLSRPLDSPENTLRIAAELARTGDSYRSSGLLALLAKSDHYTLEGRFWETWVKHHLEGRSNLELLEEAERQLLLRPDSLQSHALAWSVALARSDELRAGELMDALAARWPNRAALLSARTIAEPVP